MQLLKSNIKRKISRKSKKSRKNKRNVIKTRKTRNSLKSMKNKVLRDINKNLKLKMKGGGGIEVTTWNAFKNRLGNTPDYPIFINDFAGKNDDQKKQYINDTTAGTGFMDGELLDAAGYNGKVEYLNSLLPDVYKNYNTAIELATARAITISNLSTIISLINRN